MITNASITFDARRGSFKFHVNDTNSYNCAIKILDQTNGQLTSLTASAMNGSTCVAGGERDSFGSLFVAIDDTVTSITVEATDTQNTTHDWTLQITGHLYRQITLDGSSGGWTVTSNVDNYDDGSQSVPSAYISTAGSLDVIVDNPPRGINMVYFYTAGATTPFASVPAPSSGPVTITGVSSGAIYLSSESSSPGTLTQIQVWDTTAPVTTVVDVGDPTSPAAYPKVVSSQSDGNGNDFVNFSVFTVNDVDVWLGGQKSTTTQTLPNTGTTPYTWSSSYQGSWLLHFEEIDDPKVIVKQPCKPPTHPPRP